MWCLARGSLAEATEKQIVQFETPLVDIDRGEEVHRDNLRFPCMISVYWLEISKLTMVIV
jgi:hypothetical protein